ncbi:MAG: hypothetical protein GX601_17205, partial [Anaerolineales bacterium]|nr:hypothetical protein [Anaerolineales bacterium]
MAKYASLASLAALIAMWAVRRPTHPPERAPQPGLIAWLQRLLRRVTPLGWALAVITLTFSAALALNVSPFLRGPTDWRWVYAAPSQPQRLWLPAAALVAYLAVACGWVRSANGAARPRWQRIALFAALLISVPALQLALIAAEHTDPLRPLFYRTVSAGASGVFSVGSIIEDMSAFLRQYPTLMPTFPVHPQRYPPGLALLFYAARRVFEAFPALADGVGSHLRQYQCHDLVLMRLPNTTIASAVIQMALPLVSGLTLLPLYGLARHLYDRRTATWVAALYPLVPSFALWSARWEQFYPLLTCVAWYFFYVGLTQSRRWALFASGVVLSISSMLNFSLVSLLLPLGLFTLVWLATHRDHLRSAWRGLVTGGLVFLLGLASLWILYQLAFGTGFVDIWRVSMGYHLGLERGYWTWLVYHLYDFLVFLGLPLAVLWLVGVIKALRGLRRSSVDAYTVSVALGLFLLDLSGTSRGEVARVWLFLTPLVALAAAHMLVRSRLGQSTRGFLWVASLLAIQLFTFNTYLRVVTTGLVDPPARTSTYAPPSEYEPVSAQFGDSIALLGYDISPTEAAAGETLHLTLYWQALEPIDHTYTVATHVVGSDGTLAGQQDNMPVHDTAPTTCWLPGEVIADPYDIAIDAAAPPGSYTLETGLYIWESGERLPAVGADADRYNMVSLAELEIGSP